MDAALTELAVVPLPIPEPRNRAGAGEADTDAAQRLAGEAVTALTRVAINRRLAELRARQRRMSPDAQGYRELFEEIVGLESRRM